MLLFQQGCEKKPQNIIRKCEIISVEAWGRSGFTFVIDNYRIYIKDQSTGNIYYRQIEINQEKYYHEGEVRDFDISLFNLVERPL